MCVIMVRIIRMIVMLVMCCFSLTRPFLQEKDNVNEFKNAKSVKDEKGDEPPDLPQLCRMPESIAFEDNGEQEPNRHYEK
jgi:hypothetical protein